MLSYIFRLVIIQSILFSQVTDVNLILDSRNIKNDSDLYLEELQNDIKFYITSTNFLNNIEELEIELDINMIIESVSNNNIVSAHILFSNRLDRILFSDGVDFKYIKGQNLLYSNSYNSLTSFLNYNIFLMIAGELDKYNYKGGENYYIRSEDIAFQGTLSEYPRRWTKRMKKCRELKENIYLRNIQYLYTSLHTYSNSSEDEFDEEIIIEYLENIYDELLNINDDYGYNKDTILFLNLHLEEVVDLYLEYNMIYVIKFLIQYDEENAEFYKEYIE